MLFGEKSVKIVSSKNDTMIIMGRHLTVQMIGHLWLFSPSLFLHTAFCDSHTQSFGFAVALCLLCC